jgi:hypothetical protein
MTGALKANLLGARPVVMAQRIQTRCVQSERARMTEPRIVCPKCNASIKLTESLAAPLIAKTRKQIEQQLAGKEREFAQRDVNLRNSEKAITRARQAIDTEIAKKLRIERTAIAESESVKARLAFGSEIEQRDRLLTELQHNLNANNVKLAKAQQAHADIIRKTRELDDAKREVDLSVQKKVQESLAAVRDQAKTEAEDSLRAKVSEREAQITGMQRQIEELRRKADQGSQQLQGEALELELETSLRERFSGDIIEAVPNGEFGGDIIHRVRNEVGRVCGTMLWEAKSTKAWNSKWPEKLRKDQRSANAKIGLIVSNVLPAGLETFDRIDNVWVTKKRFAIPLAIALRQSLIEVSNSRQAEEGQRSKMEMVYQYLTGPQFRQRIDVIVEKFTEMQSDLSRERKAMVRIWAKREEQLKSVLDSSAGLYGDLQGIAGRALPEIEGLDLLTIGDLTALNRK